MYVQRTTTGSRMGFPVNYGGTLPHHDTADEASELSKSTDNKSSDKKKYVFKRHPNISMRKESNGNSFLKFETDELILLAILAFLYIGCEHSKDNLILMGVIAYVLFYDKLTMP